MTRAISRRAARQSISAAGDGGRHPSRLGRGALIAAAAVAGALIIAPAANAAQTFGSNLAGVAAGSTDPPTPRTFSNAALPDTAAAGGLNSPINGVVVRWRIKVGASTTSVTPRITRPGNSDTRTGAGTGDAVTPTANAITTSDTRLPVLAGDGFGVDWSGNLSVFDGTTTGSAYTWNTPLVDGGPPALKNADFPEVLINADIEADADNDDYGDETQDLCPTDASTQGACPVVPTPPPAATTPVAKTKKCKKGQKLKKGKCVKKKRKKKKKKK